MPNHMRHPKPRKPDKPRKWPKPARRSTGKPTKDQLRRWIAIKETGCVCCLYLGLAGGMAEIHHQNLDGKAGQKRLGHDQTIGLCSWHHRGVIPQGCTFEQMFRWYGPPLTSSREFREFFGDDATLLARQNELIQGEK